MNKKIILAFVSMLFAFFPVFVLAQHNSNQLPKIAKEYIVKHFKGYEINYIVKDRDVFDQDYSVYVCKANVGYKMEFDKHGNIQSVESEKRTVELPSSVVPAKILEYVKSAYPNSKIVEWSKDRFSQTIELNNDLEVVFNNKGEFLRVDD